DDAVAVTDGSYSIEVAATDPSGLTSTRSIDVVVDRRMPGVLSAPAPGATLAGTAQFAFTPTAGFTINQVRFSLSSPSVSCSTPTVTDADPDGVFRVSYDTSESCGEGER